MNIYFFIGAGIAILGVIAVVVLYRRQDTELATGKLAETNLRSRAIKDKSEMQGKEFEQSLVAKGSQDLEEHNLEVVPALDEETLGVTRRQFLNRGIIASFSLGLATLGVGVLQTLWPNSAGGFGSRITVGTVDSVKKGIKDGGGFYYYPLGRMWITEYPKNAIEKAKTTYTFYPQVEQGLEAGVVALFQTCPHLGCRVPDCKTSQWFECPCHGSQYNRVGEKKGGPAPRGMDRFPMEVTPDGQLVVDTGKIIDGPPIGVNTTGQEAEGPNCLSSGGGH